MPDYFAGLLDIPKIIGHRGACAVAPENTLISIRHAAQAGAKMVEVDVRLSADGIPIVLHDDTLERTTNGSGRAGDFRFAELRQLDAGYWKAPRFTGEPIPSLRDVILLCKILKIGINIELKPNPGQVVETAQIALTLARALWPPALPLPIVSSFWPECLQISLQLVPHWPRGLLFDQRPADWLLIADTVQANTLHLHQAQETCETLRQFQCQHRPILLYTVNDPNAAKDWFAAGATALITDEPAALMTINHWPRQYMIKALEKPIFLS